jgi:hypothetical protein
MKLGLLLSIISEDFIFKSAIFEINSDFKFKSKNLQSIKISNKLINIAFYLF